jgi:hypothetical protein
VTKKLRYKKAKNLSEAELNALGAAGWELIGYDKDEAVLKRDETRTEYMTVQQRPRSQPGDLQALLDELARDGWRLATALQGPRAMDAALVFEREAG